MTISVSGNSFSGSAYADGFELRYIPSCEVAFYTSSSGTVSGTFSGDSLNITFNFPIAETGRPITPSGTATLSGNTLSGEYTDRVGSFTLTRQ